MADSLESLTIPKFKVRELPWRLACRRDGLPPEQRCLMLNPDVCEGRAEFLVEKCLRLCWPCYLVALRNRLRT